MLFSGCQTYYAKPDTELVLENLTPGEWQGERVSETSGNLTWNVLSMPQLQSLISTGLENNLTIADRLLAIEGAGILLEGSERDLRPSLNLFGPTIDVSRNRDDGTSNLSFSGSSDYEADLWGRVRNSVTRRQLALENSEDSLLSSQISITGQIARTYVSIRVQDETIRLLEEQLANLKEQRRLTNVNLEVGLITRLSVDQLDVSIEDRRSAIERAQLQRQTDVRNLAILLGQAPHEFNLTYEPFEFIDIPRISPDTPATALLGRPDIRSAERNLLSANLSLEDARNAWLPTLSVSATASTSAGSLNKIGDLLSDESLALRVAGSLFTTLLDSGVRGRSERQSEVRRNQSTLQYEATVLSSLNDIEQALNAQNENIIQIEIQSRQQEAQERVTATTLVLYRTGEASAFDLIREQQNALNVRQQRLNNWRTGVFATISLLESLGVDPSYDFSEVLSD